MMADTDKPMAAIILAAGLSQRMGAVKALLPFGATTVLGHVIAACRAAGVRDIRVVVGHQARAVAAEALNHGATPDMNAAYETGMFTSVQVGLAALSSTVAGALVLPVDVPLIRGATLRRLLDAAGATPASVLHPTFAGRRGHPPVIASAAFSAILGFGGDGGLRAALAQLEPFAQDVAVFDRGILMDMDWPGDYAALAARVPGHAVPDDGECLAMLVEAGTPTDTRRHSEAVAALASALAERLAASGCALHVDLVRAAALLHDIAKGRPNHAEVGAEWIARFGFPDVAAIVARHMDCPAEEDPSAAQLVFLADKLVAGTAITTLAARFAPGFERYGDCPDALDGVRRRFAAAETILAGIRKHVAIDDLLTSCLLQRSAG